MSSAAADGCARALAFIEAHLGHEYAEGRRGDMEQSLGRIADRHRLPAAMLPDRLAHDRALLDEAIGEVAIGETYFFREPAQFDALRTDILPGLRRQRAGAPVRAWSVGCSTGEEAYSLAILLEEEGFPDDVPVLGTDVSAGALARARAGVYGAWSLRDSAPGMIGRYFAQAGQRFELAETIRRRVQFRQLNLAAPDPDWHPPAGSFDLIFCRNVLIYFAQDKVRAAATRLAALLADGGWLVLGPSDPPLWSLAPLTPVNGPGGLMYRHQRTDKRAAAKPLPPAAASVPARRTRSQQPVPAKPAVPPPAPARDDLPARLAALRKAADRGALQDAERDGAELAAEFPLEPEVHYLNALVLLALDRIEPAGISIRRALFLDGGLAAAHYLRGTILVQSGRPAGARRAFRTAQTLCAGAASHAVVPLADGETAAQLAAAAAARLRALETAEDGRPA